MSFVWIARIGRSIAKGPAGAVMGTALWIGVACCAVAAPDTSSLPVRCPAVELDERRHSNHPGEPAGLVDLVVSGTARDLGTAPDNARCRRYEVSVESVVYGHWQGGPLVFRSFRTVPTDHGQIFNLIGTFHDAAISYELKFTADASDLWAQRALAQARWDWHVLSASALFVGRIVEPMPPEKAGEERGPAQTVVRSAEVTRRFDQRPVRVERWLSGGGDDPPSEIIVEFEGIPRKAHDSSLGTEPQLFFAQSIDPPRGDAPRIWHVAYRQPAALMAAAEEALRRRDLHPVVETSVEGRLERHREIVWQGPLADALRLLTSSSESAVLLGRQRLWHSRKESLPLVAKEVDAHAVAAKDSSVANNRRQYNLIRTLGMLEEHRADGRTAALFERLLESALNGRIPAPAPVLAEGTVNPSSEAALQANHSLVWMFDALQEPAAARRFGPQLLSARTKIAAAWKPEIDWAIAIGRVEEHLDLDAAIARSRGIKAVRSVSALWHDGQYEVAFSPSGRWLATVGGGMARIWRTSDWARQRELELSGSIAAVVFTPDEQHLLVAGERSDRGLLERIHWPTGKSVQSVDTGLAPIDSLVTSADHTMIVTASDTEERIRIWQWPEARVTRTIALAEDAANIALRPDGKVLLREVHAHSWRVERLDGQPAPESALSVRSAVFSPDGALLYSVERPGTPGPAAVDEADNPAGLAGEPYVVRAREADDDFSPLEARSELVAGHGLVMSAEGRRLAVVAPRETTCTFTILDLPSLRTVSKCQLPLVLGVGRVESVALSPDGAILAASLEDEPPVLFNTETGQRFMPGPGHAGRILSLHFDDDGQSLQTVGEDGWECTWDAATLKILKRSLRGAGEPKSPNGRGGPDGQLTEDSQSIFRVQVDPRGRSLEVHVFDVATGTKRKLGEAATPWLPVGPRGLVPGGRYFHAGTQIYDRQTLKLLSAKRLRGMDVQRMAFTRDGRRYAAVVVDRPGSEVDARESAAERTVWVRIHETANGETLWAFPSQNGNIQQLAFAPDGRRLALVYEDNTLEVWPLPGR